MAEVGTVNLEETSRRVGGLLRMYVNYVTAKYRGGSALTTDEILYLDSHANAQWVQTAIFAAVFFPEKPLDNQDGATIT